MHNKKLVISDKLNDNISAINKKFQDIINKLMNNPKMVIKITKNKINDSISYIIDGIEINEEIRDTFNNSYKYYVKIDGTKIEEITNENLSDSFKILEKAYNASQRLEETDKYLNILDNKFKHII